MISAPTLPNSSTAAGVIIISLDGSTSPSIKVYMSYIFPAPSYTRRVLISYLSAFS